MRQKKGGKGKREKGKGERRKGKGERGKGILLRSGIRGDISREGMLDASTSIPRRMTDEGWRVATHTGGYFLRRGAAYCARIVASHSMQQGARHHSHKPLSAGPCPYEQ